MNIKIEKVNIQLQLHPFFQKYSITDIVEAMEKTNIHVLALSALDDSIYPFVKSQVKRHYKNNPIIDDAGIILWNAKCLLNAREYNTRENFHILTVGYSFDEADPKTEIRKIIDRGLEHNALVFLDHPFVDNGKTHTAGHISLDMEQDLEKLCKEYSGQIALEWNGYCIPWMRQVLKSVLNIVGFDVLYYDVNKKVEELSDKLKKQGYFLLVIATTDLHARGKKDLEKMDTSRIITDVKGECASAIVSSMKDNIFSGNYQNIKEYVSSLHLLKAFCLPILFPKYYKNSRA